MKHPDHDDELDELFSQLRAAPPAVDPARVALGFESRVVARVHANAAPEALRWFWRWSAIFGTAAMICTVLVVQNYNALTEDTLAAIESGSTFVSWSQ